MDFSKQMRNPPPFMSHDKYEEKTAHSKFKPGSLCWARLDATRIWPAVVMDPTPEDLVRYPYGVTSCLIFVNFLVVDYHKFIAETDIWDYRTGAEMFSRTNAANPNLAQAVNELKLMSELPSNNSTDDEASPDETEQTGGNEVVDVYEFHNEDALSSDEQITPFSQAGRKTNPTIQELQETQLNHLVPKVVLERHIPVEYTLKDSDIVPVVKTAEREEKLAKNEANANMKTKKQQGKKQKGKGKAKQSPEEKIEKKVEKRKTQQKTQEPVENTEKVVKKRKTDPKIKEPAENTEKIVKKRKTDPKIKAPAENTEKIVKKRKTHPKIKEPEENTDEIVKKRKTEQKVKESVENTDKIVKKRKTEKKNKEPEENTEKIVMKRKIELKINETVENTEQIVMKRKTESKIKKSVENTEKIVMKKKTELKIKKPVENAEKIKKRKVEKNNEIEEPEEKAEDEPKQGNMEEKVECEIDERSLEERKSGLVKRKIEPYQVKPKERKLREKKKIKFLKVKFLGMRPPRKNSSSPRKNLYSAESVFNAFKKRGRKPQMSISVENMPDSVEEIYRNRQVPPDDLKIGFMGLGTFGRHLANKLLLSCHKVYLWDKAEWKVKIMHENICRNAFVEDATLLFKNSPEELATECDIIIICLPDYRSLEFLLHAYPGFLQSLNGKSVLNFTTMTSDHSELLKKKVVQFGGRYLTVGLTDNSEGPQSTKFNAIVSGDESLFGESLTCLSAITNSIYFMDKSARAVDVAKLVDIVSSCVNVACSSMLTVCERHNLEPSSVLLLNEAGIRSPEASAVDSPGIEEANHLFNNYTSPKAVSERLEAVMRQINNDDNFPMIDTLNEIYKEDHRE